MAKHYFGANGKRDIHGTEQDFDNALIRLETTERWGFEQNRLIVVEYLKSCKRGKTKSGGRHKRISKGTLYRILGKLRLLSEKWLCKPFDEASSDDWMDFYDRMEDDVIYSERGKPFTPATKAKNYKTFRKFLKWRYGDDRTYPEFCADWVTHEDVPTRDVIERRDIDKLLLGARHLKGKALVMVLFDGGFRAEELGNLRWIDVKKQKGKDYYIAHVRKETSKTKRERFTSLGLCTDYLDSFREAEKARLGAEYRDDLYLFPENYGSLYKFVIRITKRVLGKQYSPHAFRHASATFYAEVIETYQEFCYRYGWDLNSSTAQRYFHKRSADKVAGKVQEHEISGIKIEFERMKIERDRLYEQINGHKNEMVMIRQQLEKTKRGNALIYEVLDKIVKSGKTDAIRDACQEPNMLARLAQLREG